MSSKNVSNFWGCDHKLPFTSWKIICGYLVIRSYDIYVIMVRLFVLFKRIWLESVKCPSRFFIQLGPLRKVLKNSKVLWFKDNDVSLMLINNIVWHQILDLPIILCVMFFIHHFFFNGVIKYSFLRWKDDRI